MYVCMYVCMCAYYDYARGGRGLQRLLGHAAVVRGIYSNKIVIYSNIAV